MRNRAILLALACLAGPSMAQAPSATVVAANAMREQIHAVIAAQIDAFHRNDGGAALAYATPSLRAKFEDGPHFIEMVRRAYPAVFRQRSFAFTTLSHGDGEMTQKVEIEGLNGIRALAIYELVPDRDGAWHIAGCALTKSEQIDI